MQILIKLPHDNGSLDQEDEWNRMWLSGDFDKPKERKCEIHQELSVSIAGQHMTIKNHLFSILWTWDKQVDPIMSEENRNKKQHWDNKS